MRILLPLLLVPALLGAAPAHAQAPATRARALLAASEAPAGLRASLLAHADSVADLDPEGAAEALGYAGTSFQREGRMDSAIVCHRRALQLGLSEERVLALVDPLLLRHAAGDANEAITRLTAAIAASEAAAPLALVGRLGWAHFLKGDLEQAEATLAPVRTRLAGRREWAWRLGRLAFERKDHRATVDLLLPVAVRSRGTDDDAVGMLETAARALDVEDRVKREVQLRVMDRDRAEVAVAESLRGGLRELVASDRFPLGALLVPSARGDARRSRAVVLLLAPGDTLAAADSLVSAFRRHGLTTLVLHVRGHGASVGPSCPSPDAWFGREAALEARVARDVQDAFRVLRRLARIDTTAYVVAAAGASVTMAVDAARLDPRVAALLLVSPAPHPVELGRTRARIAALRLPVFYQVGGDIGDRADAVADLLYQAGDRSASRVVEANVGGRRLEQFRYDPALAERFLAWLDATLRPAARPARAAPRPTPPRPRRRG